MLPRISILDSLDGICESAARAAVIYLWLHVPLIAFSAFITDNDIFIPMAVTMALAVAVTADWRRSPAGESIRPSASAGLTIGASGASVADAQSARDLVCSRSGEFIQAIKAS